MRNSTEIPGGYKDSPLGVIPKDWQVLRIKDFAPLQRGFDLPTDKIIKGKYPVVYSNGILNCHNTYKAKGPGVVTGRSGTIGKVTFVKEDYWPHNTSLWVTDFNGNNPKFVFYFYQYLNLSRFAAGSGVPTLNRNDVHAKKVVIPPVQEQSIIVSVLEKWDEAIEMQAELIDKLKLRKRGLMQQLLTGRIRLPGFTSKWKQVRLGEVCSWLHNVTFSRDQLNGASGVCQNVHYGDVLIKYQSILDCNNVELPYINDDVDIRSTLDLLQDGDIIMSDTAEDETVGKACEATNVGHRKILAGLHTMLIRPKADIFAPSFLGYYINSEAYHKQLLPLIQGIKVCSLSKRTVQNTILAVPSINEQKEIVKILFSCDVEIQSAIKKKAVFQTQKRGIMQQLLTGKKRIMSLE